jgi:hypothetical protein
MAITKKRKAVEAKLDKNKQYTLVEAAGVPLILHERMLQLLLICEGF